MTLKPHDYTIPNLPQYRPQMMPVEQDPGFFAELGAAFERNTAVAAMHWLSQAEIAPDPNFDFESVARQSELYARHPQSFLDVRSEAEFRQMEARVKRAEDSDRLLAAGGYSAWIAGLAAGVIDPVNLLPAGSIYKGYKTSNLLRTLLSTGAAGAVAAGVNEAVLQADIPQRTAQEGVANIATSALLSAVLGGTFSVMLRGSDRQVLGQLASDMVDPQGGKAIYQSTAHPSSLGAAVNPEKGFENLPKNITLAPGFGFETTLSQINPIGRVLSNELSPTARSVQASLDTGGMAFDGVANIGGDIETLAKGHYSLLAKAAWERDRILGGNRLSRLVEIPQFNTEVSEALRMGGQHSDPAVAEYAKWLRANFFEPLYREASAVDMEGFRDLSPEYVQKYAPRFARHSLIARDYDEFYSIIYESSLEKLTDAWSRRIADVKMRMGADEEVAKLLDMDVAEAGVKYAELRTEMENLPEQFDAQIRDTAERIRQLREDAKGATREEAKRLRAEAKMLEESNKDMLAPFQTAEKRLKNQFRILDKSRIGIAGANRRLVERIEATLKAADKSRDVLVKKLNKLARGFEELSEEARDKAIEEAVDQLKHMKELELKALARSGANTAPRLTVDDLPAIGKNRNGVPEKEAVASPLAHAEYPYDIMVPRKQSETDALIRAKNAAQDAAPTLDIPLSSLVTDVGAIGKSKVKAPAEGAVLVEKIGNTYHLRDGNHRAAAAFLKGEQTIKATVVDMNPVLQQFGREIPDIQITRPAMQLETGPSELNAAIARFEQAADELRELTDLDPAMVADRIENIQSELIQQHELLASKRKAEVDRLTAKLRNPNEAKLEAAAFRAKAQQRWFALLKKAADDKVTITGDVANIDDLAKYYAETISSSYLGEHARLPFVNMLQGERGPELARVLDIDETRVWSNGKKLTDFLENDIDVIMRRYLRTMAPDIELKRKFGTVNPLDPKGPIMLKIEEEFQQARAKASEIEDPAKRDKALTKIASQREAVIRDLQLGLRRVRNLDGIPQNPYAVGYRLGRAALNLNTARLMGKMVIGSMSDMASLMARHGPMRFMRDGLAPLVADWKKLKLSLREAQLAGAALDLTLHGRSAAFADIFDDLRMGTRPERGLQFLANNIGFVSGMDAWNQGMKTLAANLSIGRTVDALERVATGKAKKIDTFHLERLGIDSYNAQIIWEMLQSPGGSDVVNGVRWPNTEEWGKAAAASGDWATWNKAAEAKRAFRAALTRDIDDTIVTPGGELPAWTTANMPGRLVAQFRSFTFSSTMKTLIAGLQQARVHGRASGSIMALSMVPFFLASGALSYYLWARTSGSKTYEEMQNADIEKWITESILRGFPLGVMSEVPKFSEEVLGKPPEMLTRWLTGNDEGASYSESSNFSSDPIDLLGPSVGLARDISRAIKGFVDDKDGLSAGEAGALKRSLPYNNLWVWDWILRPTFEGVAR